MDLCGCSFYVSAEACRGSRHAVAKRGFFISFEGGEGAGKSTQIRRLASVLEGDGHEIVLTREPGGSPGAEAVRHVLLSGTAEPFGPAAEAILFAAARSDHVEQVIRPAIARGAVVLCDRFLDSTRVYQGAGSGLDAGFLRAVERVAINGMMPDLTIIFDLDPEEGLRRVAGRQGASVLDRFEKETLAVHAARRAAYLAIAEREPERCVVIDADDTPDAVAVEVLATVRAAMRRRKVAAETSET